MQCSHNIGRDKGYIQLSIDMRGQSQIACGQRVKLANTCAAFATTMCENADLWTILSLKHCWNWENTHSLPHTHTHSNVGRTVNTEHATAVQIL